MDETAPNPPTPIPLTPPQNQITRPKSKLIYLIVAIILIIIVALGGFLLLNKGSKQKNKQPSGEKKATTAATSSAEKVTNGELGYVTALEGLNLRKEASLDATVLLILPNATEVEIINTQGDWYFVEAQVRGFVAKEFISKQKPSGTVLKIYKDEASPLKFLYPDNYQVSFTKNDTGYQYSFTGNESVGGFKVETVDNMTTIGNYALKNYPTSTKTACDINVFLARKECEKVSGDSGTIFLVLEETTLYKISYLKTEGGLLTDLNNLVFPLMVTK